VSKVLEEKKTEIKVVSRIHHSYQYVVKRNIFKIIIDVYFCVKLVIFSKIKWISNDTRFNNRIMNSKPRPSVFCLRTFFLGGGRERGDG
jgi:hypothetical protein